MSADTRGAGPGRWTPGLAWLLWVLTLGGASLVVRFRRARGVERQQLRWVAAAAVVAAVGIPVAVAGISIDSAAVVGLGSAAVLCLAIAAAVLRSRPVGRGEMTSMTRRPNPSAAGAGGRRACPGSGRRSSGSVTARPYP